MASDRCELLCLDLEVAEELRLQRLPLTEAERAAGQARALADPTRLMLAAALAKAEELCVCDLAWIAERSQTLVSYHLRALRAEGLVRSRRVGKMGTRPPNDIRGSDDRCFPVCSVRLSYKFIHVWPGASPRSSTTWSMFRRRSSADVARPAGPPPTMTTGYRSAVDKQRSAAEKQV